MQIRIAHAVSGRDQLGHGRRRYEPLMPLSMAPLCCTSLLAELSRVLVSEPFEMIGLTGQNAVIHHRIDGSLRS